MKYYKLIKQKSFQFYKEGTIYPGDWKCGITSSLDTEYFKTEYPNDFTEVSEREYWQQELDSGKLVKGGYYKVNYEHNNNIFKYSHSNIAEYYFGNNCDTFKRNGGVFDSNYVKRDYILATEDEIQWLEACNKAHKFITKEEFMKSKEFVLPEKWCVKDCKEVSKWASDKFGCAQTLFSVDTYLHVDMSNFPKRNSYNFFPEIKTNYTEITFEQFKEHVLKEKTMEEKEIIGYKLVKPEYKEAVIKICSEVVNWRENDKFHLSIIEDISIPNLKEAGVLDIWFEPVYKEEFKVGDWVVVEKWYYEKIETPQTCQISEIKEPITDSPYGILLNKDHRGESGIWWFKKGEFRKATSEEIEKAQEIKIKGYKAVVNSNKTVSIGCQTFTFSQVEGVIVAISSGLKVEDSEQIKKLWERIKEQM